MLYKRVYFFVGVLNNRIYVVGGKFKDGGLVIVEVYNFVDNIWELIVFMSMFYYVYVGVVYGDYIYVSGGYSGNYFILDM